MCPLNYQKNRIFFILIGFKIDLLIKLLARTVRAIGMRHSDLCLYHMLAAHYKLPCAIK